MRAPPGVGGDLYMSMTPRFLSLFFALSLCFASISALAKTPAKQLFGAATSPSAHVSKVFGGYAKGCLAGGGEK
jgi:murein endopeptidase